MHRVTEIILDKHPGVMSHIHDRTGLNGIKTCPFICNVLSEMRRRPRSLGRSERDAPSREAIVAMRLARDRRRVECPFDSAARFDRINFPDVLDALPPRASAFGTPLNGIRERSRPTRRAEDGARDPVGGFVDDDPRTPSPYRGKLALEALDVEEARAAELADCTIEVLANSRPAPLTPILSRRDPTR